MAWYDSGTRGAWGWLTGADYAVDPSTESATAALERYNEHLDDMEEKKGWPSGMVTALKANAAEIQQKASTEALISSGTSLYTAGLLGSGEGSAQQFWNEVAESSPGVMVESGHAPGSIPKIDSHIAFLQAWGASASSLNSAVREYNPISAGGEALKQSAIDYSEAAGTVAEALNPKKSPWPWIIGGVAILLLVREFK